MNVLTTTVAKYLFALPFAVFGLMHFINAQAMAGMVPIPGGVFFVYLTGLALILATVSIIIGKKTKLATLLLGIMLLVFALSIHLVSVIGGDMTSLGQFLKDTSLAGAAFFYSGQAKD